MSGLAATALAALALVVGGCTVPDDLLEDKPCPCLEGWVCQAGVCVREDEAGDGGVALDAAFDLGTDDAGPVDGGATDMPPEEDAFVPDGGPPGPTLIGHWECESLTTGVLRSTMRDASGGRHEASCSLVECPSIVVGRIGNGCQFDGDQELRVPTDDLFDPTDGFSVAVWARTPFPMNGQSLVAMPYGSGVLNSWQIYMPPSEGTVYFVTTDSVSATSIIASGALGDDVWHHVIITWDGTTKRLFIDGVLTAEEEPMNPAAFVLQPVLIGRDENEGAGAVLGFTGILDDVRVYDGPLDGPTITELATAP